MNNYSKDLEILNTIPDEEWTAKGMSVFDSDGDLVAETQDIEDARYIASVNPRRYRDLLERVSALEKFAENIIEAPIYWESPACMLMQLDWFAKYAKEVLK